MLTLFSILALGFFLGMRHATDSDHVVAVTTFVSRERSLRSAAFIGVLWGIGHSLTLLVIGGAIILFGLVVPQKLGLSLEFCVALMLILLGVVNLRGFIGWTKEKFGHQSHGDHAPSARAHALPAIHVGKWTFRQLIRPLAVGVVHGLAGSAAVALLVLPIIQKPAWAVCYLLIFGLGTIAGMMLITAAIAAPCQFAASRSPAFGPRIARAAALLSLGFGLFLVYQIGFVQRLFFK